MSIKSIGIIGTGKVGQAFALALHRQGLKVSHLVNRSIAKAQQLAKDIPDSRASSSLPDDIDCWPSLWIICVNDDNITQAIKEIARLNANALVCHTSGSFNTKSMHHLLPHLSVLYPLQTFSEGKAIDFQTIPLCIYAPDEALITKIKSLAHCISNNITVINDEDRQILHLSAVFINNFTNAMIHCSQQILNKGNLSPDLLMPLLYETVEKLTTLSSADAQTGPAIRGDQTTIDNHMKTLANYPEIYSQMYRLMTDYIQKHIRN